MPSGVRLKAVPRYRLKPPLVKKNSMKGEWYTINFAVGCTHGCVFCYADHFHKKYSRERVGDIVLRKWGQYFAVADNLEELIAQTPWWRWRGKNVFMSSAHDPFLPQLAEWGYRIARKALSYGIHLTIATRSTHVEKYLPRLAGYENLTLMVSIPTLDERLSRLIEPRVAPPRRRLEILEKARSLGIRIGALVAPLFPPIRARENLRDDLDRLLGELARLGVDVVYSEALHRRGMNLHLVERALGERVPVNQLVEEMLYSVFAELAGKHGLRFVWVPEYELEIPDYIGGSRTGSACCVEGRRTIS